LLFYFENGFNPWHDLIPAGVFVQWVFKPKERFYGILSPEENYYAFPKNLQKYLSNAARAREMIYVYYMLRDNIIV
jgi:hypothetical protein